jgi:hypothetical protein
LAAEVDALRPQMQKDKPYFICSDKYPIASCLAFYLQGHPRTYCVYQKRPLGQKTRGALERRMNQFDIWEDEARRAGKPTYGDFVGQDAIFVTIEDRDEPEDLPKELKAVFAGYEKFVVKSQDEFGYNYAVFICHDFKGMKVELPDSF